MKMTSTSTLKLFVVIFLPLLVSTSVAVSNLRKKQLDPLEYFLEHLQWELEDIKQRDALGTAADSSDESKDDETIHDDKLLEKDAMKIAKDGTYILRSPSKKLNKSLRKKQTGSETTNNPLSTSEFSTPYPSDGSSSTSVQPVSPTSPSIPIPAGSSSTAYPTDSPTPTPNPGDEDADLVKPLKALLNALRKKMSSACLAVGQSCGFHHGRTECCRGLRCTSDWSGTCDVDCVAPGESCRQNWFCCDGRQCVATTIQQQTNLFTQPEVEYVCQ